MVRAWCLEVQQLSSLCDDRRIDSTHEIEKPGATTPSSLGREAHEAEAARLGGIARGVWRDAGGLTGDSGDRDSTGHRTRRWIGQYGWAGWSALRHGESSGRVSRVDPRTGAVTTYASGLPPSSLGGAMDVAFLGGTAYVLVTLVGPDVGERCRRHLPCGLADDFTVIADIGTWSIDHPPATAFDVPSGVQYAMDTFRNGFLVTDGHLNRVLGVT